MLLTRTDPAGLVRVLAQALGAAQDSYANTHTQKDKRFHAGRISGLREALTLADAADRSIRADCGVLTRTPEDILAGLVLQECGRRPEPEPPKTRGELLAGAITGWVRTGKLEPDDERVREQIIVPIADRIATEYGTSCVTPPTGAFSFWGVDGIRHGIDVCTFLFDHDGRLLHWIDPDDTLVVLADEGLIPNVRVDRRCGHGHPIEIITDGQPPRPVECAACTEAS